MTNRTPLDPNDFAERKSFPDAGRRSIGPSDSSDAGSDLAGLDRSDDDTDREGTGERSSSENKFDDSTAHGDIGFDRVVEAEEAGLGRGLDQAEEARIGITDEELEELARRGR